MESRSIGPYHMDREGPVTWRLREAASPHRAWLSDALLDHLARDGHGDGGTAAQIAAVTRLPNTRGVVNSPDVHHGFGSPIGTVYVSPSTLSLPVVGVDVSCGMAVVLTDLHADDLQSRGLRLDLHGRIHEEIPMGKGVTRDNGDVVRDFRTLIARGADGLRDNIREALRLGPDSFEFEQDLSGQGGLFDALPDAALGRGEATLGSLGGGNHFIELQTLEIQDEATAKAWGLFPGQVVVMIHSGSRAFGSKVADFYDAGSRRFFERERRAREAAEAFVHQRWVERSRIERRSIDRDVFEVTYDFEAGLVHVTYPLPADFGPETARAHSASPELAQRPDGGATFAWHLPTGQSAEASALFRPEHLADGLPFAHRPLPGSGIDSLGGEAADLAEGYWTSVQAAQNFAVLSRTIMLYRAVAVLNETFGPDRVSARHLYDISHNNVQTEFVDTTPMYVHRKGATRAFPGGHAELEGTCWSRTGHPVIVPGSLASFSYIMRAAPTARESFYSVNHGAGRTMSRTAAKRDLDRDAQQAILDRMDVVAPDATLDEMPDAYKDIDEVVRVCVSGGLTHVVAKCHPRLNLKGDPDDKDD